MEARSVLLVPLRASANPRSANAHINQHHRPHDSNDPHDLPVFRCLLQRCSPFLTQPGSHKAHPEPNLEDISNQADRAPAKKKKTISDREIEKNLQGIIEEK